jgi:hypothetical protein
MSALEPKAWLPMRSRNETEKKIPDGGALYSYFSGFLSSRSFFCLGANNMTHWTDGSKFSYNNFPASQPDGGCSYLRIDGVWGVGDCGNLTHVLCKRGKTISLID